MMADFRRLGGKAIVALSATALLAAPAFAGPDWDEGASDAGSTLGTAQVINTTGTLNTITGKLTGTALLAGDYQDCFLIEISDPTVFSLSTAPGIGGEAGFDPMMFLFRVDTDGISGQMYAKAIMANNDKSPGNPQAGLQRAANDGSNTTISQAGLYLIAISGFGSQPVNAQGQFIFNQAFLQPGIFAGPNQDQQVGDYLLAGWNNDGSAGTYTMSVQGISGTQAPAPGASALLALGALAARRRRQR